MPTLDAVARVGLCIQAPPLRRSLAWSGAVPTHSGCVHGGLRPPGWASWPWRTTGPGRASMARILSATRSHFASGGAARILVRLGSLSVWRVAHVAPAHLIWRLRRPTTSTRCSLEPSVHAPALLACIAGTVAGDRVVEAEECGCVAYIVLPAY